MGDRSDHRHEPLLDIAGAAAYLATTESHVQALIHKHSIPHIKVGCPDPGNHARCSHPVRFFQEDLHAYLVQQRVEARR